MNEADRYDNKGLIHDRQRLKELQALSLERKIGITVARIIEWYSHYDGKVYISFSGGKDSTVLLNIARKIYPDIEAVYVDTGLEYPEIKEFVKSFENVRIIRPERSFRSIVEEYGYPVISKEVSECVEQAKISLITGKYTYRLEKLNGTARDKQGRLSLYNIPKYKPLLDVDFDLTARYCSIMKKRPLHKVSKELKPITAQMASESRLRTTKWLQNGCNSFNSTNPISNPMSFWLEQDVLEYIKTFNLPIAKPYGEIVEADGQKSLIDYKCKLCTTGCERTGCLFCGFGLHREKGKTRFQQLKETHPKLYNYVISGGEYSSRGKWKPSKSGLGMGHVFDVLNSLYGDDFMRYK